MAEHDVFGKDGVPHENFPALLLNEKKNMTSCAL
jgi:hypothetical protein